MIKNYIRRLFDKSYCGCGNLSCRIILLVFIISITTLTYGNSGNSFDQHLQLRTTLVNNYSEVDQLDRRSSNDRSENDQPDLYYANKYKFTINNDLKDWKVDHSMYKQIVHDTRIHSNVLYLPEQYDLCNVPRKGTRKFLEEHRSDQIGQEDWPRFLKCDNYINKYLNLKDETIHFISVNATNNNYELIASQFSCVNPNDVFVGQHPAVQFHPKKCKALVTEPLQSYKILGLNMMIAPYFSLSLEGRYDKIYLAALVAGCSQKYSIGQIIRKNLIETNWGDRSTFLKCHCLVCPNNLSYMDLLEVYQRTTFCLLPIGDTMASRRLYDAVLNKCIPVIIGPPYHPMPIIKDWSFAVIIKIEEIVSYFNSVDTLTEEQANLEHSFRYMSQDYLNPKPDYIIRNYSDLPHLLDILATDKAKMKERMDKLEAVYEQLLY